MYISAINAEHTESFETTYVSHKIKVIAREQLGKCETLGETNTY